ncbi:hypothetical protein [Streptomyces sp. Isolate_219]|uniref:hypothetical protein n=1 Tax=Streptomyces sp. Isolate_219 TaxID=2950110 RepID=UPI0021C6462A|nr:hypothetical protein [Streptomyces sp. Isolate_219]MCR8574669.1 hypothetical protein [Streptomyces sp. Isolate_219]
MGIPGNYLSAATEAIDPGISGWAAKLNCSISLGSGGRNGAGVLALQSAAAGEAQARTASSYPVAVGQTYAAFADASGATVPERIGIQWLTDAGTEVSVSWGLTTSAASANWHRISVGAVAPVGATRARVLLSMMTPGAAGVIGYFENIYLGLPLRQPLNLLSFNAESGGEIDSSAWAAGANGTLSRMAPVVSWSATWYYSGGQVLALTVTASGDASAVCVERPSVQPGTEYLAYAYLNPPTSASNTWVELRFYDGTGAQIQANRGTLAAPGTGWYRQSTSGVAPAGAVSASIAFGITGATAGQVVRSEAAVVKIRTANLTNSEPNANVVLAADANAETGIGQWTVASGPATIARSSPWGTAGVSPYSYALTVSSATAAASVLSSGRYPVAELKNWRIIVAVRRAAGGWTYSPSIRWFDASGTLIGTGTEITFTVASDGQYWAFSSDQVAPAGAVSAQLDLTVTATAASSVLHVVGIVLIQVLPAAEAIADDTTASVAVVYRGLAAGALTLYRVLLTGERTLVRGADGLVNGVPLVSDTYSLQDYEAPLGVEFYYQAEVRSLTTGAIVARQQSPHTTLAAGDRTMVWLKDPIEPMRNVQLQAQHPLPTFQRPIEQAVQRVIGRRNAVTYSGERSGAEGDLVLFTRTAEERRRLDWLLDPGHVLFIQASPRSGWRDLYAAVGEAGDAPDGADDDTWRDWTLPLTEVDRPTSGQAGSATRTWNDIRVENATWGDVLARYDTWLDVLLNRPKTPGG